MTIKHLKLYHFPATRSARVRWALYETVGEAFDVETLQLYQGEQHSKRFLTLNPNHAVPVLEITFADDRVMSMIESVAMVQWLVDAHPDKQLAPAADVLSPERADYLQMLHFGGSWMDMMLWQIRTHEHLLPDNERDQRTVARYRSKFIDEVEPQIRDRLELHPYICGDSFSAADIIIGHNVSWARGYKLCQAEIFRAYLSRVAKRPAFQLAFADAHSFKLDPEGS